MADGRYIEATVPTVYPSCLPADTVLPRGYSGTSTGTHLVSAVKHHVNRGDLSVLDGVVRMTEAEHQSWSHHLNDGAYLSPNLAARYKRFGIQPWEAEEWVAVGIFSHEPEHVACAVAAGMSPDDYRSVAPLTARGNLYGKMTYAEMVAKVTELRGAEKALAEKGVELRYLGSWIRHDWDLDAAILLEAAGLNPSQANHHYHTGVTKTDCIIGVHTGDMPLEWALAYCGAQQ